MEQLPVIDVAPLAGGDPGAVEAVAAELGRAAREIGFFYVAGHGIGPDLLSAAFRAAHDLFALPDAAKMKLTEGFLDSNRGYVPMQGEKLDPSRPADLKEAFNIGLDLGPDDPRILAGEPFRAVNQWPDLPGWREIMVAYFDAVWALGRRLHRAVAVDLGCPETFFEAKLDAPMATLRLLHYPPNGADFSGKFYSIQVQ